MKSPLTGIVPPLITPLLQRDRLDVAGLERLIAHILAGGVSGLFILGTSGEGPSLGYALRRELIQRTCPLVEAARAGDVTRARQLHGAIMRVSGFLYRMGRHSSAIIKGIKGALSCLGICADGMAELQVDLGQLDLQP